MKLDVKSHLIHSKLYFLEIMFIFTALSHMVNICLIIKSQKSIANSNYER